MTPNLSRAIGLALCIQTGISFLAAIVPVIAVDIAESRQWDVNAIAVYLPLVYAAAFAVSFTIPRLLARWGALPLGILCVGCAAWGELALLAPAWQMVLLTPLMIGLAIGGMNPVTSQILSPHASSRNAAAVTALKQTGVPLGAAAAGLLGPLLVNVWGWRSAVILIGIAMSLVAISLLPIVRMTAPLERSSPRPLGVLEPVKALLAIPGMRALIVAGIAYVVAQFCQRSFFTVYLVRDLGLTLSLAGLAFTISQLSGIVGQLFWAALSGRFMTSHMVLAAIGVLMALASIATAFAAGTWDMAWIMAFSCLFGFTAAGFIPVLLGAVLASSPADQAGALTSALNIFLIGGSLLGPLAFGGVATTVGYSAAFVALAILCAAGALCCALGELGNRVRTSAIGSIT
jgi:MFS family permease